MSTERQTLLEAVEAIKIDLKGSIAGIRAPRNKLLEAQRLEQRTRFDLEMMLEIGYCAGIENYSRYLSGRRPGEPPPTLFDYLPADALLVVDESPMSRSRSLAACIAVIGRARKTWWTTGSGCPRRSTIVH